MNEQYLFDFIASLKGDKKVVTGMQQMEVQQRKLVRISQKGANVSEIYSARMDKQGKVTGKSTTFVSKQAGVIRKYTQSVDKSGKVTEKFGQTIDKTGKSAMGFGSKFANIAKRALLTIPTWLLLRSVFMGIIRTIGDAIRAFVDLDDQLARIRTVMHGNAEVIEKEMIVIRTQILKTAVDSRIGIKDLAEGFYFLKTAGLSAGEAMAGFESVVNLAIGTNNSMAQSARAVAGIYNTMGKYLGDNLTIHEKFQHIADVLAYTYATQDVQLSELIQSYTKLAPYVTGLSDSFLELTTMLGFLNTRLLRGGRTGRLTGRAILQLSKNAQKLASIFDITFDPDEPVALLDTIRQIRDAMGKTGKITAEQGKLIQEVFATRGGVVIRMLLEHFDDLSEGIKEAVENAEGFAQRMKEIRMRTIAGQMQRMKNILGVLANDFLTTAFGAENMADTIKLLGDSLEALRPFVRGVGEGFAWLGFQFTRFGAQAQGVIAMMNKMKATGGFLPVSFIKGLKEGNKVYREIIDAEVKRAEANKKARKDAEESLERIKKLREEQKKLLIERIDLVKKGKTEEAKAIEESLVAIKEKLKIERTAEEEQADLTKEINVLEEEAGKLGLSDLDKRIEKRKLELRLMKVAGASALEIARKELAIAEETADYEIDRRKEELEILRAENKLIEEQARYRQEMVNIYQKAELQMLKLMGASQLQILKYEEEQIIASTNQSNVEGKLVKLYQNQVKQKQELLRIEQEEEKAVRNFYMMYSKASAEEKARLRRLTELMKLDPYQMAKRYQESAYDRSIIDRYFKYFSEKQKDYITEAQKRMYPELKFIPPELEEVPEYKIKTILPEAEIQNYATKWEEAMKQSADRFADYFAETAGRGIEVEAGEEKRRVVPPVAITEEEKAREYWQWKRGLAEKPVWLEQDEIHQYYQWLRGLAEKPIRLEEDEVHKFWQEMRGLAPAGKKPVPKEIIDLINRGFIVPEMPIVPERKGLPVTREIKLNINIENVNADGLSKEEVSEVFTEDILRILESDEVKDKIDKGLGGARGLRG